MALLKKLYETKTTRQHVAYQKYVKEAKARKRKPLSFSMWSGSSEKSIHYKKKLYKPKKKRDKPTARTKDVERRLKIAGISEKKIKKLRGR